MNKETVIQKLSTFSSPTPRVWIKDQDQDVPGIMTSIERKHKECLHQYDALYQMFNAQGSWYDVGKRLYDFCRQQLAYKVEKAKWQEISAPATIMKRGHSDCKGYALFIGGVIDAMKRAGEEVTWCYRFASYDLLRSDPGHVFVVINPKTDNIWVDPVLSGYDLHFPRPIWKVDVYVSTCRSVAGLRKVSGNGAKMSGIGFIQGTQLNLKAGCNSCAAIGSAEDDLLAAIKEYSDGVSSGVQIAQASQTINTICWGVIMTASSVVPGLPAVLAALKQAPQLISAEFGAGSLAARLAQDWANNPLTAPVTMVESIFKGRTFNSDQYRGAQLYQWYVQGNSGATALNKIADSDVVPALKWFIDRLGVFISGYEHIYALTQSPQAYMNYYNVNGDTTMDVNRVNAAYNVASKYFVFNNVLGSWQNTVGVYDPLLVQIAQQSGESVEQAAAQQGYQGVYSQAAESGAAPVSNGSSIPIVPIGIGLAALLIILSPTKNKAHA